MPLGELPVIQRDPPLEVEQARSTEVERAFAVSFSLEYHLDRLGGEGGIRTPGTFRYA